MLQLLPPLRFNELLPQLQSSELCIVATAGAPPVPRCIDVALQKNKLSADMWQATQIYLLVGPEGGFTDAEQRTLVAAGAVPAGLGPNRLRTETAAVALLAAVSLCLPAM